MDCFFINNLNLKPSKHMFADFKKLLDEEFLPADVLCISGISEDYEMTRRFLVYLGQHYKNVLYVYGGCDMKSDMPLDLKFEKVKDSLRSFQRKLCSPIRLDGQVVMVDKHVFGGATGIDPSVNIKRWNWWTTDINKMYNDEVDRFRKIAESIPDVVVSYYDPRKMNLNVNGKIWHFGQDKKKSICEIGDTFLINNSCVDKSTKYTKKDFLFKI